MSKIEWTEKTWNPITGCTRRSPGCQHCYAERMTRRLAVMGQSKYQGLLDGNGRFNGTLHFDRTALEIPLSHKKRTTWFVNSMSDLFHDDINPEWLTSVWDVMRVTPQHTYQILTKRAENMREYAGIMAHFCGVLPNVWLGVSVENADYLNRIEHLKQTPAAIRFISFEPLLGDVGDIDLRGIDWAIAGAESGPGARPMNEDWVRRIRDICQRDRLAFFYKQNATAGGRKISMPALDGVVWNEVPF